jgi:DNA-binding NarL/FixJ family response regulator
VSIELNESLQYSISPLHRSQYAPETPTAIPRRPDAAPIIRLLIVDALPLTRAGLSGLLAETDLPISVVGTTGSGAEAIRMTRRFGPDVVLLDVDLVDMDASDCIREILRAGSARVIALTASTDISLVLPALTAGAAAYLCRAISGHVLAKNILDVATRSTVTKPAAAPVPPPVPQPASVPAAADALTPREGQVLGLLTKGLSNRALATELGISEATVKAHLTKIFATLGVVDRTQAAVWAFRHGLG